MPNYPQLAIGMSATRMLVVEGSKLYSPTGKKKDSVLSTPAMVMEMELASVDAVFKQVGATVGFHVDIKHIAPTRAGEIIKTTSTLVEINCDKLKFQVETKFGKQLVGVVFHRRAIVKL